jgi:sec-independent protein translocase protein TatC
MARTRELTQDNFKEAPLLDHLEELRLRIIYAVVAWIIGTIICFNFLGVLIELLKRPLLVYAEGRFKTDLIALSTTEPFTTGFLISGVGGLILAMPVLIYQVWAFIAPGLTRRERGYAFPFIFGSIFAFLCGVAFAYFVALPFAMPFLIGFLPGVTVTPRIGEYIPEVLTPIFMFGVLFQLPVLMFLLGKIGMITSQFLASGRRIALFAIVAIAAIITPTGDPFNLAISSVPILLLYEMGINLVRIAEKQNARAAALQAARDAQLELED